MTKQTSWTAGRRALTALLTAGAVLAPMQARAGQYWCDGTVSQTWLDSDGLLYVYSSWRNQNTRLCSLNQTLTGNAVTISPATCAGWLSLIKQSMANAKPVTIYYVDSPVACDQLATYEQAPLPRYVMLKTS
ncbi:hypothetical protein CDN99_27895 [Roseateles aquatilis]|uniref:Uncharacterized protein n=1 Tax=Roseateles aquatilis TaxID=431061 RepID=A0A246IRW7_9BURK|nr:hypothetical protein [Roseateles aquatilis]OWQ82884.1 hypothetical protein CDN99_27895 [Roseateles aquatilis]